MCITPVRVLAVAWFLALIPGTALGDRQPLDIGNREEPTEAQQLVIAKSFCVAMRRNHNREQVPELRGYFDPRYLKEHELLNGDFKVRMAPVMNIRNILLAKDKRTLLCMVETSKGAKELILLQTTVHDGKLYLLPARAPNRTSKSITPWILHTSLASWKQAETP